MTRLIGLLCVLALTLASVLVTSPARAADAKPVVVGQIQGDKAEAIRNALLVGLAGHDEIRLVSLAHAEKTADRMGAGLDDAGGIKKLAAALRLGAFIDGNVKSDDGWTATIRVRAGSDGEVIESVRFSAKSDSALVAKIEKTAWKQLSPPIRDAKPAGGGAGGHQVVVGPFTGPKSTTVRGYVVKALAKAKGIAVVSDGKVKDSGIKLDKKSPDEDYAGVAASTGATALLDGTVTTKGRAVSVEINVRSGADGAVVDSITLDSGWMPGLRNTINKKLASELDGPLSKTSGPAAPEEEIPASAGGSDEEAAGDEEEAEAEEEPDEPKGRPSAFEIGAGIRGFSRNFRYTDDLFSALRSYKLGVAPAAFAWLRWYPVAHFDGGPISHLGLTGGYEQGFAVKSEVGEGATARELSTKTSEWWAGLRYRIPFDRHEIGIVATYGKHSFEVEDDPAIPFPDVEYTYIRAGLDGRVRVSSVLMGAHLGHRFLTDTGELGTDPWFPHISGGALDAGLYAGYELLEGFAVLAGFDFRRYYFSMNSEPGDANVAGGALDEYLSGWFGLSYMLPGQAAPAE